MDDYTNFDGDICDFLESNLLDALEWDKVITKSMLEESFAGSTLKKAKEYIDDPEQIKLF